MWKSIKQTCESVKYNASHRSRYSHWSLSKLANSIRSKLLTSPEYAVLIDTKSSYTMDEVIERRQARELLKRKDPIKYYLGYTIFDQSQNIINIFNDWKHGIKCTHSNVSNMMHGLRCDPDQVELGRYYDIDTRMESALFYTVKQYVECELSGIIFADNEHKDLPHIYHYVAKARPALIQELHTLYEELDFNDIMYKRKKHINERIDQIDKLIKECDDEYLVKIVSMRRSMWT